MRRIEVGQVVIVLNRGLEGVVTDLSGTSATVRILRRNGTLATRTLDVASLRPIRKQVPVGEADAFLQRRKQAIERGKNPPVADDKPSDHISVGDRLKRRNGKGWLVVTDVNDAAKRITAKDEKTGSTEVLDWNRRLLHRTRRRTA